MKGIRSGIEPAYEAERRYQPAGRGDLKMRSDSIKGEKNSLAIVKLGISFLLAALCLYVLANELAGFVFADDRLTPVQAEALVGRSVDVLIQNYGEPQGWLFEEKPADADLDKAGWYYDGYVFHIYRDDTFFTDGVIVGVDYSQKNGK